MLTFNGVIPPMITPFAVNGQIDYAAHEHNVNYWNQCQLGGLLVLGSNSEAVYLDDSEKLELIGRTVQWANSDYPILVGTGMESTISTIRLTNKAAAKGAHAALIITPHYYKSRMNDAAIIQHFTEIADQSDIPVLIYNVTKYTGINVSLQAIQTLSQHPNIIGMKDSSGSIGQLVQLQQVASYAFQVMTGTAAIWLPALQLGVKAAIMALANCAPKACVRLQQAIATNPEHAEAIYRKLVPVNQMVTAGFGIAGLKHACDLMGLKGGYVRKPLQPLSEDGKSTMEKALRSSGLIT